MVVVQADHPLKTLELIILEFASDEKIWLNSDLLRDAMCNTVIVNLTLAVVLILHPTSAKGTLISSLTDLHIAM